MGVTATTLALHVAAIAAGTALLRSGSSADRAAGAAGGIRALRWAGGAIAAAFALMLLVAN
jgi:hypothetical protein